jgi:hypothetical protein
MIGRTQRSPHASQGSSWRFCYLSQTGRQPVQASPLALQAKRHHDSGMQYPLRSPRGKPQSLEVLLYALILRLTIYR